MTTIYHNPRCSKSRQTLAILEENKLSPTIILYLENPPTAANLQSILTKLGMKPRDILRTGEDDYKNNHLGDPSLTDEALIDAMVTFPKVIERPIVVIGDKAVLGRPPENVLTLL